ncbi:MAG: DUF2029 domain-containing protein, partial [Acidobacteria bacterium]|nr:DUF2029 domain-containing protein [Acidobacteriota bacterium]
VLLFLALAFRAKLPTGNLAAAASVKLVPLLGWFPLLFQRAGRTQAAVRLAAMIATVAGPNIILSAKLRSSHLAGMLSPDTYWSNQSINGLVSRLCLASDWGRPPAGAAHLPVELMQLGAGLMLCAAAAAVVWRNRGRPLAGCIALMVAAGAVAAPKDSLWNLAMLVPAMLWCWASSRGRPRLRAMLLLGWVLIEVQGSLDLMRWGAGTAIGPLLSSSAALGAVTLVLLTLVTVRRAESDVQMCELRSPQPGVS